MPDGLAMVYIWFGLLALAGETNDNGFVYFKKEVPYTDQLLSTLFDFPVTTIQLALKTFEKLEMIEIVDDILLVSNWPKYQNENGLAKIRESHNERQRRYRERKKLLSGTQGDTTSDVTEGVTSDADPSIYLCSDSVSAQSQKTDEHSIQDSKKKHEEEMERRFKIFWDAYGYKESRKDALKAFKKIAPDEALFQKIMEQVEMYHKTRKWRDGFRKLASTWLNGECWNDDYSNDKAPGKSVSATQYTQRDYTEEELDAVTADLIEEAKKFKG